MMGQCFGTEGGGLFAFRQKRGYDRFTRFAPKSKWRYADEHLLTEIQDPRSDDEFDISVLKYLKTMGIEVTTTRQNNFDAWEDINSEITHVRDGNPRQMTLPSYASNNATGYRQGREER